MAYEEVLSVLDQALLDLGFIEEEGILNLLRTVFLAIERHVNATADDVPGLRLRLPQLLSLYSQQPNWVLLERLIARAVDSAFTAWIDGIRGGDGISSALQPFILTSFSRWSNRLEYRNEGLDIAVFLKCPEWTPHTISIIKSSIYASDSSRQVTHTFLESGASLNQPALNLAPVLWSWLDASDISDIGSNRTWRHHFNKLTAGIMDTQAPQSHRLTCRRAIFAMIQKLPSLRQELLSDLLTYVKGMSPDILTPEMLRFGKHLIEFLPGESDGFASSLLEHALGWISRSFAGSDLLEARTVKALGALLPVRTIFAF